MAFFGLFGFLVKVPVLVQTIGGGVMATTMTVVVPGELVVGAAAAACVVGAQVAAENETVREVAGNAASSLRSIFSATPASTVSQASSSIISCFEKRTISDWILTDVVTNEEAQRLLHLGFDKTTCFELPELKDCLDFDKWAQRELSCEYPGEVKDNQTWLEFRESYWDKYCLVKSPGQPTSEVGYEPPKNWDGELVRNPNGSGSGYPDKKGNVWVPTGENPSNPNAHGGPHWDVQDPQTGKHVDVFPDGKVRTHKH